jgi:hypothetical protein
MAKECIRVEGDAKPNLVKIDAPAWRSDVARAQRVGGTSLRTAFWRSLALLRLGWGWSPSEDLGRHGVDGEPRPQRSGRW